MGAMVVFRASFWSSSVGPFCILGSTYSTRMTASLRIPKEGCHFRLFMGARFGHCLGSYFCADWKLMPRAFIGDSQDCSCRRYRGTAMSTSELT
jgi:hypothetical protein